MKAVCVVCDDLRIIVVGVGPMADFLPCPSCVGLVRDTLCAGEIADVEAQCGAYGVKPRWRSSKK